MNFGNRSRIVEMDSRSMDDRGSILSIVDGVFENCSIIECEPSTIRSNHWHYKDSHVMYVSSGSIDYFFKDVETKQLQYLKVNSGQVIYTPPKELHACFFPEKTTLIVLSRFARDQKSYEADTVREVLIDPSAMSIESYIRESVCL